MLRNMIMSSRALSRTIEPTKSGSLPGDDVREVLLRRDLPADVDRRARRALDRRQDVVAQPLEQLRRRLRLRAGLREHDDRRDLAVGRELRRHDDRDVRVALDGVGDLGAPRRASPVRGRSVASRNEPLTPGPKPCAMRS